MVGLKLVPMRTTEQRSMFGTRIKIIREEQLVDSPIDYHPTLEHHYKIVLTSKKTEDYVEGATC